jgi:hypothetical protein
MNSAIQVIKGKKLFVIIETMFGVANSGYAYPLDEFSHYWRCNALKSNPNTIHMPTIFTSDREVKRLADSGKLN